MYQYSMRFCSKIFRSLDRCSSLSSKRAKQVLSYSSPLILSMMMRHSLLCTLLLTSTIAALPATAADPAAHPVIKREIDLPPSATLHYRIKAKQSGLQVNGEALVKWNNSDKKYVAVTETHAMLLGKILETSSEGDIDSYGLAPARFVDKRFRREASITTFDRELHTINFTQSTEHYPLKGGEQDRTSIIWQLIAIARANGDKFTPGSEWLFFVAGPRDAEQWSFQVTGHEKIRLRQGEIDAVHVLRAQPSDDQGQKLDIWLAPSLDWYPARLRFTDPDGDFIEQTLDEINKTPG
jgi:hypothetical protein